LKDARAASTTSLALPQSWGRGIFEERCGMRTRRLSPSSLPQDWGRVREVVDAVMMLKIQRDAV
jgi:hypothetical protein